MNEAMSEMPRYRCHKEVWALKITNVDDTDGVLNFAEGYAPITVGADFMKRHGPKVGGYYVTYLDGYKSFSPGAPFEEGYSRI
jgi:hypothetical protein